MVLPTAVMVPCVILCYRRTPHESSWTPILWALRLIEKMRAEGKLKIEAPVFANLVSAFDSIEASNR